MKSRQNGFTLVELLVALTVAGLVVAAAHAALGALSDAASRSRAAREPVQAGAAARAMLEGWMRAAAAPDSTRPFLGTHRTDGREAVDELSFFISDAGSLRPGPQRVRLWVDRDLLTPAQGLLAELRPVRGGGPAPPETLQIAAAATGLTARYLVRLDGRDRWLAEWQSELLLPRAVELRLTRLARIRLGAPDEGGLPPLLTLPLRVPMGTEVW